eukprot:scaffold36105_cov51-Phaeocystis_antarctica.AAC.1
MHGVLVVTHPAPCVGPAWVVPREKKPGLQRFGRVAAQPCRLGEGGEEHVRLAVVAAQHERVRQAAQQRRGTVALKPANEEARAVDRHEARRPSAPLDLEQEPQPRQLHQL